MNLCGSFKYTESLLYVIWPVVRSQCSSSAATDNNAKIRSFAAIGIQLREMHPLQGYLHNCKHSIKFSLTSCEIQIPSKQLSFARIVISITSKEYSFA